MSKLSEICNHQKLSHQVFQALIALVGYNNVEIASFCKSQLTTASTPSSDLGSVVIDMLLKLMQNPYQKNNSNKMPTELKVRSSCGYNNAH